MNRVDRTACAVCGIGFPAEDLIDVDGAPHCPRCYALTGAGTRRREGAEWAEAGAQAEGRPGVFTRLVTSVREWAAGRNWWVRAPVLLWMAWILVHYWSAPWYSTIFHGIDLAVHEIGHILWAPLGEFMGFAGGTLTQLLAPLVAGLVLLRQKDWFGVSFALCWLGINCFEIVEYAGDALTRRLPLVSPSTAMPIHDWTYMLGELGILHHTDAVAAGWQWAGRVVMTGGIVFGAWVLWEMRRGGRESRIERLEVRGERDEG